MRKNSPISSFFIAAYVVGHLMTTIGQMKPRAEAVLPPELSSTGLALVLRADADAIHRVSTDFGNLTRGSPAAVLYPFSEEDIAAVVGSSFSSAAPFAVVARGRGHSIRGQAMAENGVVVAMASLSAGGLPRVGVNGEMRYADVGGEQLWVDVLWETLRHGLSPLSWTDYLHLSVGGTLSNGGVSGQAFRHGPQISNVLEMDVVTGKGEIVTCSREMESELFYGVLGGLGQFGIITRARIALGPAPTRVKWVRLIYTEFSSFVRDQETLISSKNGKRENMDGFDYVEGSVIYMESLTNNWRSSFFSKRDQKRILALAAKQGVVYCLEASKYSGHLDGPSNVDEEVELLLKGLNFVPGLVFSSDVSYTDFLNRVHEGELKLRAKGMWEMPHPWLNLFVPKSRIMDFNQGVFKGIILKRNATQAFGPILVYPTNKHKWDDRMSAVTPNEEIFYAIGLLQSSLKDWEYLEDRNEEILRFCDEAGIELKQYLPHYQNQEQWKNHFGEKWNKFLDRKMKFDPKGILSPGQKIFNPSVVQGDQRRLDLSSY